MKNIVLGGIALTILAGTANAADMPARMPLKAPPVVSYDWNGFYLGGYWGTAIGQSTARTSPAVGFLGETSVSQAGLTGGGEAGVNWQFNPNWLLGLEGDIGYLGTDRTFSDWNEFTSVGVKTDWYGTVRGRFGYVTGPSLLYATGGVAFVHIRDTFGGLTTTGLAPATNSTTRTGWTAGGGIETKLSRNWSSKTEYLYIDAGDTSFASNPFGVADTTTFSHRFHVIKSGLNYKFGGPDEGLPFFNNALLAPAHNWAGFYAGVNAGGGISLTRVTGGAPTISRLGETDLNGTGFSGGVQAGYNIMVGPKWFVGVEGDIGYLGLNPSQNNWNDSGFLFNQKTDWFGTLRGRVGTTTGPALLYVTAGGAMVRVKDSFSFPASAVSDVTTKTEGGWTVGGGTEVALDARWSARLEYLYVKAGTTNHSLFAGANTAAFDSRFQVVRVGLNYRFGGDDVVTARY